MGIKTFYGKYNLQESVETENNARSLLAENQAVNRADLLNQ